MKKMKNWIFIITGLMMLALLICMPINAAANEIEDSGTYGESIVWTMYEDGSLYLDGTGEVTYDSIENLPWRRYWVQDVYISAGITYIQGLASNQPRVWVDADNPVYSSDAYGVLFNQDKTTLLRAPQSLEGYYVIPETVTSMEECAFVSCEYLEGIKIPAGVTEIPYGAFLGCTRLYMVDLPNTITEIGGSAFYGCSLSQIQLPESLQIIQGAAFYDTNLQSITIPANVHTIEYNAFRCCSNLQAVYFQTKSATIESNAFEDTMIDHMMFAGSQEEWSNLTFASNSDVFQYNHVTKHYNCTAADGFSASRYKLYCTVCDGICSHDDLHTYTSLDASCIKEGIGYNSCSNCNWREYFVIEKNDYHNPGDPATETEPQICLDCGAELQAPWGNEENEEEVLPPSSPNDNEPDRPTFPNYGEPDQPTSPSYDDDSESEDEKASNPSLIITPGSNSHKHHNDDDEEQTTGSGGIVIILIVVVAVLAAGAAAFILLRKRK